MIEVTIFIDNKHHGSRYWPQVPRVGEKLEVLINKGIVDVRVLDVLWWHQSLEEFAKGETKVSLFCTSAK